MKKLLPLLKRASRVAYIALFCLSTSASTPPIPTDPLEIALNQIGKTGRKLGQTHKMAHVGVGMEKRFLRLELCFQVQRKMSKDEARDLLFVCAEELMNDINANERLRPYLLEYPFTLKNVEICFYLSDSDGKDLYHPDICVAAFKSYGLYFRTNDPDNEFKYLETSEETHEEALALARGQGR